MPPHAVNDTSVLFKGSLLYFTADFLRLVLVTFLVAMNGSKQHHCDLSCYGNKKGICPVVMHGDNKEVTVIQQYSLFIIIPIVE